MQKGFFWVFFMVLSLTISFSACKTSSRDHQAAEGEALVGWPDEAEPPVVAKQTVGKQAVAERRAPDLAEIPADYPHQIIPIYQPSVSYMASRSERDGQPSFSVMLLTKNDRSTVVDFYKKHKPVSHSSAEGFMDTMMFMARDGKTGGSVVISNTHDDSELYAEGYLITINILFGAR